MAGNNSISYAIQLEPRIDSDCVRNVNDLKDWIERARVVATTTDNVLGYIVGATTPSIDDRDKIWLKTTSAGRPLGLYAYDSTKVSAQCVDSWTCVDCRTNGELKTIRRTEATITADREAKSLTGTFGWSLADSSGGFDLTQNDAFFDTQGTGETRNYYTVFYSG